MHKKSTNYRSIKLGARFPSVNNMMKNKVILNVVLKDYLLVFRNLGTVMKYDFYRTMYNWFELYNIIKQHETFFSAIARLYNATKPSMNRKYCCLKTYAYTNSKTEEKLFMKI